MDTDALTNEILAVADALERISESGRLTPEQRAAAIRGREGIASIYYAARDLCPEPAAGEGGRSDAPDREVGLAA